MSSNIDNSFLHVHSQCAHFYREPPLISGCDCTSYSYFFLSIFLLVLGSSISVSALGGPHHAIFSNLGHMWLIGPLCICCGTMVGFKSILYLRRKSIIKMLLSQRCLVTRRDDGHLSRHAAAGLGVGELFVATAAVHDAASSMSSLPPNYETIESQLNASFFEHVVDIPPPAYIEAIESVSYILVDNSRMSFQS